MGVFEDKAQQLLDDSKFEELFNLVDDEIRNNPENEQGYVYKVKALFFQDPINNNYEEINKWCDILHEKFPENYEICWIKLQALRELYNDDTSVTRKYCDDLIAENPTNPEVYAIKASCLEVEKMDEWSEYEQSEIIELYNKAIELQPEDAQYYLELADVYETFNKYDLAKETYQKALVYLEEPEDIEWCKGLIKDLDLDMQNYIKNKDSMEKKEDVFVKMFDKSANGKWGGEPVSGAAPTGCIFLIIILVAALIAWFYFKF